ncbi:putative amidohydrolase [Cytobacillus purgationiresistens]|uniref:Amidohydrolase n=1 Tax=Cytobacillus purgationiresistens TaxID=863449 RepID=A0ABU0AMR4_9BACI|nr:putative amidohydrolase [Cytobacillus purgationiresistens]
MGNTSFTVKVAVIQAASVFMDKDAALKKAISLIKKAGNRGAKIAVFPEAFIPAYPRGFSFGTIIGSRTEEGRRDWYRYWDNSISVPDKRQMYLVKQPVKQVYTLLLV